MRALSSSFRRDRRGSSVMEFALLAPLLLLFTGGLVELAGAYQKYIAVNRLAARYAISWADCGDAFCGAELLLYASGFSEQNISPQLSPASAICLRMFRIRYDQSQNATVLNFYVSPACPNTSTTPSSSEFAATKSLIVNFAGNPTAVVVFVSYTYNPLFFSAIVRPFIGNNLIFSSMVAQLNPV